MSFRPQVIRADTIDLQDTSAPSAQDHTQQPAHPAPLGLGPAAPHQDAEIRQVNAERNEEEHQLYDIWHSGHMSNSQSELFLGPESHANGVRDQQQPRLDTSMGQDMRDEIQYDDGNAEDRREDEGQMDDKMSSSPSIIDEDIDFEFVYALHNFVATVEGQANANKGDTMVLLDDSNSYWWLVRLMRDNSIGYLPAEHIETPTERLARLNKHRNIDLSASMLGDNAEKSKNPIKKAMRRRNAKMVTFTNPTFYEPVVDWSDTEPEASDRIGPDDVEGRRQGNQLDRDDSQDAQISQALRQDESGMSNGPNVQFVSDKESLENAVLDPSDPNRSRNGGLRNEYDAAGTRKMTLTPDLLREDASRTSLRSPEPQGRGSSSPDISGRISPASEKMLEEKKKDKKKPNMLSGLFKRKDKKIKVDEAAGSIVARQDENGATVYSPTATGRASPSSGRSSPSALPPSLRTTRSNSGSKLATVAQTGLSSPIDNVPKPEPGSIQSLRGRADSAGGRNTPEPRINPARSETPTQSTESVMRQQPEQMGGSEPSTTIASTGPIASPNDSHVTDRATFTAPERTDDRPAVSGIVTSLRPEDVDSPITTETPLLPQDATDIARSQAGPVEAPDSSLPQIHSQSASNARMPPVLQGSNRDSFARTLPPNTGPSNNVPAPADNDLPVFAEPSTAPLPHNFSNPTAQATIPVQHPTDTTTTTTSGPPAFPPPSAPQTTIAETQWDDAALGMYLDRSGGSYVRDMLIIIGDKTGVVPLPKNHPMMLELGFHEKQRQLDDMSRQLDDLLMSYVELKGRSSRLQTVQ